MSPVFRSTIFLAAGRGASCLCIFLIPVTLARILTIGDFGTYKQLFLIYSTIYALGLGLAEGLYYFLPAEPARAGRHTSNSLVLLGGAGITGLLVLALGGRQIAQWFDNPALGSASLLLGSYVVLTLMSAPLEVTMISRGRDRLASLTYALSDLLRALFMLAPALLWRSLEMLLAGAVAFAAFRLVVMLAYLRGEFGRELSPDNAGIRRQFMYSLPLQIAVVLQILQTNLHQYFVSAMFDAATFAIYAAGCLQIPLFEVLGSSACSLMMVEMGRKLKQSDPMPALRVWWATIERLALMFFPLLILLYVISQDLVTLLFTEAYRNSVPIFRIWLLVFAFAAFQTHGVLRAFGDTRFLALQNVVKLVLVGALIPGFVAAFGLSGAVASTALAVFVGQGLLLSRIRYLSGVHFVDLLPWSRVLSILALSLAAAPPALAVGWLWEMSPLVQVICTTAVYAFVFTTLCYASLKRRNTVGLARTGDTDQVEVVGD